MSESKSQHDIGRRQTVLFLCTGNFYRSRFAEIYFIWLAGREKICWQADSRGLALDPNNIGPISIHTRNRSKATSSPTPTNSAATPRPPRCAA